MASKWRMVTSTKPNRAGEAFLLRDDKFVLKVYKDSVPDVPAFAEWLCNQLQQAEARKAERSSVVED